MRTLLIITAKTDLPDAEIEALRDRLKALLEAEQLVEVKFAVTDADSAPPLPELAGLVE